MFSTSTNFENYNSKTHDNNIGGHTNELGLKIIQEKSVKSPLLSYDLIGSYYNNRNDNQRPKTNTIKHAYGKTNYQGIDRSPKNKSSNFSLFSSRLGNKTLKNSQIASKINNQLQHPSPDSERFSLSNFYSLIYQRRNIQSLNNILTQTKKSQYNLELLISKKSSNDRAIRPLIHFINQYSNKLYLNNTIKNNNSDSMENKSNNYTPVFRNSTQGLKTPSQIKLARQFVKKNSKFFGNSKAKKQLFMFKLCPFLPDSTRSNKKILLHI